MFATASIIGRTPSDDPGRTIRGRRRRTMNPMTPPPTPIAPVLDDAPRPLNVFPFAGDRTIPAPIGDQPRVFGNRFTQIDAFHNATERTGCFEIGDARRSPLTGVRLASHGVASHPTPSRVLP
jgi:hypothetical protein